MRGDDMSERKNAFAGAPGAGAARRRRWLGTGSIAVIAAVRVGWYAWRTGRDTSADPHVRHPGRQQPICASPDGRTLYADVDGDGVATEVHDSEDRDGRRVVTFVGPGNRQARNPCGRSPPRREGA
ncbi:hypothetical protein ACWDBW_13575 [Streptomyces sp. NPDC001107]